MVLLASKAATIWLGARAPYAAQRWRGMADVDTITLSLARLAHGSLPARVAVLSIFVAAASNPR